MVTDPSGRVVASAVVEATSRSTSLVRRTATTADGVHTLPLLNPATYRVKATHLGFRTSVRDEIEVVVNETVRADFALEVGNVEAEIAVAGASSLVETRRGNRRVQRQRDAQPVEQRPARRRIEQRRSTSDSSCARRPMRFRSSSC
jgi:hypothetical protein